jgi:2,5-diketo-D-gluconate reductase A
MTEQRPLAAQGVELADGVHMPLVGLGTWMLRGSEGRQAVEWALEAGYRHLDTATMYGNESEVGAALAASGIPRDEVFVTTKLPPERVGRELPTLEDSLTALGVDHVDLWLVHWPPDWDTAVDTWRAFAKARESGLATAIGVSNHSVDDIDRLVEATGVRPQVNQIKWSPFLYDRTTVDAMRERGVTVEGYSPFKAGRLDHPVIAEIAERHHKTPAQVVVRWHVDHGVVVIPKSARRERIVANADVFDFGLDPGDLAALDGLGSRA